VSVTWTSGYLQALAGFVGLVAVGGLLLYLETRQRSRVASYALARRMGLRRGTHLRSLMGELIVLLGLAFALGAALAYAAVQSVYRLLDVDPNRAPPPLLTIPILCIVLTAAATMLVAVLAATIGTRAVVLPRAGIRVPS